MMSTLRNWSLRLGIAAVAALLCTAPALAQPDPNHKSTYGVATLKAGFLPDPYSKKLTAGGTIRTNLGGVNAYVAKAPDFTLHYTKGVYALTIYGESAGDTTLLVQQPDGKWLANDDGGKGLNPLIRIPSPQSGRYQIWVGTYSNKNIAATLHITERNVDTRDVVTSPKSGAQRPFFIIGHHANTAARVNEYVNQGANFIECDLHNYTRPLTFSGSDKIYVMHFLKDEFTRKFTNSDGVDAYFRNIKSHIDAGRICGIELDIKSTLVSDGPIHYSSSYPNPRAYGRTVANLMKRHNIPANRVIMGVDKTTHARGSAGDNWSAEFMKGVRWDAKYDCLHDLYVGTGGNVSSWASSISATSDVGSLGKDQSARDALFEKFSGYANWLEELVRHRDAKKGDLRFVYFWTVNSDVDLRNCLDRNVDGIITDEPARLKALLNTPKYQAKYRIANRSDYPIPLAERAKRSLADPYVYLTLRHQGGYVAKFNVTWRENGAARSYNSGSTTLGWSHTLTLPRNATGIRVHAQAAVFIATWRDIHNGPVSPGTYTASGTTGSRRWSRN